ncbi:MAG: hypothetical protein Q9221_007321 [Calogaya cf. arnoldii]
MLGQLEDYLPPNERVDPATRFQAYYARATIDQVRDLFITYNQALKFNSDRLSKILQAFKIDNKEIIRPLNLQLQLAIPEILGLNAIAATSTATSPTSRSLAQIWSSALSSAPLVASSLFPPSPQNVQQFDLSTFNPSPTLISTHILSGLTTLLTSLPSFLNFTQNGTFSSSASPSNLLFESTLDLHLGTYTFLTSRFMQSQNLYAIPGEIVDEASWERYIADGKCYGRAGKICIAGEGKFVYWSPNTKRSYELKSKGGTKISVKDLVEGVNEGGFADPELLFDGNYNCTAGGRAGRAIVDVKGAEGRPIDVSCLSQLPMYLVCGTPCPEGAVRVEGLCPFGNVTNCG